MTRPEGMPSPGALEEVRRLAGPAAVVAAVERLEGGQHAETWRVDTKGPATRVVVREFPVGDSAPMREQVVLRALDGLGGLAPVLLGGDLDGRWSKPPTSLISWLDGEPDITPADPGGWARELGRRLAAVHAEPAERLAGLPSVFDDRGGSRDLLAGPLAAEVRSRWSQITASPEVLTHGDYWSGNVVWRDGKLTGIVDWSARLARPTRLRSRLVPPRPRPPFRRADRRRVPRGLRGGGRRGGRGNLPLGLLGRRPVRRHGWVLGPELPAARPRRPRRRRAAATPCAMDGSARRARSSVKEV